MNNIIEQEAEIIINAQKLSQFGDLFNCIDKPIFGINDTGTTSRIISHWEKEGLLNNTEKEGKWRKFALVDLIWIRIIKRMRDFNCTIKMIKDLKDSLYEEIKIDSIEHKEQLERVILKIARSEGYSEDEVKQILVSEKVKEEMSKYRIRLLKIFILDVTILKSHFALIFNSRGEFFPYKERYFSELQKNDKFREFMQNSHISISLTEILSDFILDTPLETVNKTLHILTDDEAKIIETVRSKDVKSITIKKGKNDTFDLMTIQNEPKLTKADRLTKLITKNSYQVITIKVSDGEVVHCKNERLEKFKKYGTGLAGPNI